MEKILIIDDDVQLTELLIEFLGSYKYDIVAKHTPEEGLDYLEKKEANVIILDIMLPGMDGFQVLRKIRDRKSTRLNSSHALISYAVFCLKKKKKKNIKRNKKQKTTK